MTTAKRVEYHRKYRIKNREKKKEYARKYRIENKEKIKEYRIKNKEKIKERCRIYYLKNKEKILEGHKIWNEKNKEKTAKTVRKYRIENKEKINKHKRLWRKNAYDNNPEYKLVTILRARLSGTITKKYNSALHLIGCTIEELIAYLESLFEKGMSWENYGMFGWHIDHIIPCKHFDLTDLEEQKKCFHYTNLQPLWAKDNLNKGAKLNWRKEK